MRVIAAALFALITAAPMVSLAATVTTLHRFRGAADGAYPVGPLITDAAGNLYGVTAMGGGGGYGVIYRLTPPAAQGGAWTETILHDFARARAGAFPSPPLVLDARGNLLGVTYDGGNCFYYCGTVFKLSPPKTASAPWHQTILYRFGGAVAPDGGAPDGALLADGAGGYFGTTQSGGARTCSNVAGPCGTVFQVVPPATPGAGWSESVLYNFGGPPDGETPAGGVVADASGNLYGAATQGGTGHCTDGEGGVLGCGAIFELHQNGSAWDESLIYQFKPQEQNDPAGPLLFGADGALYGTAGYDIFRLLPPAKSGQPWDKQVVYQFKEGLHGTSPFYNLAFDSAGNLYGTTTSSGLNGSSSVFELTPGAGGTTPWTLTTLATFGHGFDSEQPRGGMLIGANGTLYGVLAADGSQYPNGSVFAITP